MREALYDRVVELVYCPTEQMTADILTKPHSCGRFETYESTKCQINLSVSVVYSTLLLVSVLNGLWYCGFAYFARLCWNLYNPTCLIDFLNILEPSLVSVYKLCSVESVQFCINNYNVYHY